jgi:hypothetical protein
MAYENYYYTSEPMDIDEVNVLFKGQAIFRQYPSQTTPTFWHKFYKMCDASSYNYGMRVYLRKGRKHKFSLTATHATVIQLISKR